MFKLLKISIILNYSVKLFSVMVLNRMYLMRLLLKV